MQKKSQKAPATKAKSKEKKKKNSRIKRFEEALSFRLGVLQSSSSKKF